MNTTCSKCDEKFEADPQKKEHRGFLHVHYFQCPHCQELYIAYVTDNEIREELSKTTRLRRDSQDPSLSFAKRMQRKRKLSRQIDSTRELMERKREEYAEMISEAFTQEAVNE